MKCIYCFQPIHPKTDWSNVLRPAIDSRLCEDCHNGFEKIDQGCPRCCNPRYQKICPDCDRESPLLSNTSFLHYNEFAKEWITRWKYRGDYELLTSMSAFLPTFVRGKGVPVPLSEERLDERGFNQAEAISRLLMKKTHLCFGRTHSEKQSKKTKRERLDAPNPFYATTKVQGHILLIDDIYTTGTTMKQAAAVLKENGATSVRGLTLFHS
ncbi:ComF family protein [Salimicrobium flavidum]|uniref:Competence protein ComFC n=1 Tax=Salimicrobium flavidum TaxID=570947 RepID=A0A1N7J0R6_9BACI|nr:ComF family protein [Salimicrobium flavidum]SIS42955.1 competence protein ComFC [Salimicrobium flavidum]